MSSKVTGDPPAPAEGAPALRRALYVLIGIVLLGALVVVIEPLRNGVTDAVSGDTGALRGDLRDLGVTGVLIVFALGLVHVVVWYPAEILDTAVGYVYGFWLALPMVMAVWLVNGLIAYAIGRHVARPVLYRFIDRERFDRFELLAERGGVPLLLSIRLVPVVPFSLFSYAAGTAHVPVGRFIWTTIVGYLPLTAIFVYFGSTLEEFSATDPVLWLGAAVLIGLMLLTVRLRRMLFGRRSDPADEAAPQETSSIAETISS